MKEHYVFIDYENGTIKSKENKELLPTLKREHCNVIMFVGVKEKFELDKNTAHAYRIIQISGTGKNALDLHIAFYIGQISTRNPHGKFYVLSGDKGSFDPLVEHLTSYGIFIKRFDCAKDLIKQFPGSHTTESPNPETPTKAPASDKPDAFGKILQSFREMSTSSRPKSRNALFNKIKNSNKDLSEADIDAIIDRLIKRKHISLEENKVVWNLEKTPTAS